MFLLTPFRGVSTRSCEKLSVEVKFQACRPILSQLICHMERWQSRSAAARSLGCSRRTVQRYCKREPGLVQDGKVDVEALKHVIRIFKFRDSRGFPLGHKRPERELPLDLPKQVKPIIRRTLVQRLEIMRREIDAMTDDEQVQMLEMGPEALWNYFRESSFRRFVAKHAKAEG